MGPAVLAPPPPFSTSTTKASGCSLSFRKPANHACGEPVPTSAVPDLAQTASEPNCDWPYVLATLLAIMSCSVRQVSALQPMLLRAGDEPSKSVRPFMLVS